MLAKRTLLGDVGFRFLVWTLAGVAVVYLTLPIIVITGAAFTASEFLSFPPKGLSLRWFARLLDSREIIAATWISLVVASLATLIAILVGVAASFPLVRLRSRALDVLASIFMSPLVVPTVVYGLSILLFLNVSGIGTSFWALVLGHLTIIVPYILRTTISALNLIDPNLEEAAVSLGAGKWRTFWHVVLPPLTPAIVTGSTFAFLASFDNLIVSLFLVGAHTETLPIRIYALVEYDIDPVAAAASAVMALVTLLIVILLERFVGLSRAFKV